jgi:hypothetical protein
MYYYIFDQNGLPLDKFERLQTQISGLLAEFKIGRDCHRRERGSNGIIFGHGVEKDRSQ